MHIRCALRLSLIVCLLIPLGCSDEAEGGGGGLNVDDLHGEWIGAVEEDGAEHGDEPALMFALDLDADGDQVSGRYVDTRGNRGEVSGSVDGKDVELTATHQEGHTQISASLEGVVLDGRATLGQDGEVVVEGRMRGQKQSDEPSDPQAENRPPSFLLEFRNWDGSQCMLVGWATVTDLDGDSIVDTEWDLGDGTIVSATAVNHTYEAPGEYTVSFTATDSRGATRTSSFTKTAKDSSSISGDSGLCAGGAPSGNHVQIDQATYDLAEVYWNETSNSEGCSYPNVSADTADDRYSLEILKPIRDGTAQIGEVAYSICEQTGIAVEWNCFEEECVSYTSQSGTITAHRGDGTTIFEITATMSDGSGQGSTTLTAVVTVEDE